MSLLICINVNINIFFQERLVCLRPSVSTGPSDITRGSVTSSRAAVLMTLKDSRAETSTAQDMTTRYMSSRKCLYSTYNSFEKCATDLQQASVIVDQNSKFLIIIFIIFILIDPTIIKLSAAVAF